MKSGGRGGTFVTRSDGVTEEFDDGRSYNASAVRQITQSWVDFHMDDREDQFTESANVLIFTGTWNVNAKKLDGELNDWLLNEQGGGNNNNHVPADIYAIGFQEIVDLNAINVALDNRKTQSRGVFWSEKIIACLQNVGNYTMICEKHLVAHTENVEGRNLDFKNIIERSVFPSENDGFESEQNESRSVDDVIRPRNGSEKTLGLDLSILDHEIVFWFGDLNYRIDETPDKIQSNNNLDLNRIFDLIERKDYNLLKKKDQLNLEREKGHVFQGFVEGELTFAPTYKYQPNTNHYDTRPEKKTRAPAWCDRILYKIKNKKILSIKQMNYFRSDLLPSDHKPVGSLFECKLRVIINEKESKVYQEIMKKLDIHKRKKSFLESDKNENPNIAITGLKIKNLFVQYDVISNSTIVITNNGDDIAHWRFVPKLDDTKICKKWITVSQQRGLLLPGEAASVILSVLVDKKASQLLNLGREVLNDILVLRIENSVDSYVEVGALLKRSCFGLSLEELVCTPQAVSSTPLPAVGNDIAPQQPTQPMLVPKELWRLVDSLWTGGALRERNLFLSAGADAAEVFLIRDCLDDNTEFPVCSPHSIVEVLVTFLGALSKPLLPPELYPTYEIEDANLRVWCRKFLEFLPPLNYNAFVYLISFLRDVIVQGSYNRSTPSSLSAFLVQSVTPSIQDNDISKDERARRELKQMYMQKVIHYFLTATFL